MDKLSDAERRGCGSLPCPMVHPWLVFPYGENEKFQVFVDPLNPSNAYQKRIPEMCYHSYRQPPSREGWLIMSAYEENNSPFDEEIPSPYFLLYCHPGDEQWRKQNLPSFKLWELTGLFCLKGKLYLVSSNGHGLFEVNYDEECDVNGIVKITPFCNAGLSSLGGIISSSFKVPRTNIIESQDQVFKVTRYYYHPYNHVMQIVGLEVFRMDFSTMAWKELKSLDDHVLFLDSERNASVCTSAAVSCSATKLRLSKGCIFFVLENDKTLYKFDIEDGSIGFSLPCPHLPASWMSPSWMSRRQMTTTTNDVTGNDEEDRKASINNNDDKKEIIMKNNGIEVEEESRHTSWGSLSQDNLESISSYLHLLDYLHFRAVCRENRLATTTKMKHKQYASLSPWMIFRKARNGVYNLAEPIYNDKFFINVSDDTLVDGTIRFSKVGWLLMTKASSKTIFFYNPFTRAMINLPDLPDDFPVYNLSGMSFSSLPTSSDCVIMGIAADWVKSIYALSIKRGDDSWISSEVDNTTAEEMKCVDFAPSRNNPVFYKGGFYCLDFHGKLGVLDRRDYTWKVLDLHEPCDSLNQNFLVKCEGNLLGVFLSHSRTCVKVFKLDIDKKLWVKVESLGKNMLFVSNTSSLSAVAPNSRMKNKIYFPRFHGEDIVYYSLDTCQYHTFGSQQYSGHDFYRTREQLYSSWIHPNWSHNIDQELVWCS